jgi:hypothetical protein
MRWPASGSLDRCSEHYRRFPGRDEWPRPRRQKDPCDPANASKHAAFERELTDQAQPSRPKGLPQRNLALAADAASQHQGRDVDACDQHHNGYDRSQNLQPTFGKRADRVYASTAWPQKHSQVGRSTCRQQARLDECASQAGCQLL